MGRRLRLRRPRTTGERRAACGARCDVEHEAEDSLGYGTPAYAATVRRWRRQLRAYMRCLGLPGRTIRRICGLLHQMSQPLPCPYSAVRAALALEAAP